MASKENGTSPMNPPSYEEAVSSPVYSPYPETCSCPSYEDSIPHPPPPPPYTTRDRLPASFQLPDSFWAGVGGLPKNTADEETGNGNSALRNPRCRCSLMEALGYTETASCPQCTNSHRGGQENPLCCQRDRQKQTYGCVFPCELRGICPCSRDPTGECKCEGGNTTTTTTSTTASSSSSPSSSSFSDRTRRFHHKVKEWLAV